MKFKVGDKVWVSFNRPALGYVGELPGVVIGIEPAGCPCTDSAHDHYCIDAPDAHTGRPMWGTKWHCREEKLRPRFDDDDKLSDYDGNKVVRWDQCPWQPEAIKEVVRAESLKVDW